MPPSLSTLLNYSFYLLRHLRQACAIIYWKTCRGPIYPRDPTLASENRQECYRLLALTSRSFVAVCAELGPELHMPVVVFYLILRALDTLEDDMTLALDAKVELLRGFWEVVGDEAWSFTGSGPEEKDRDVLVRYGAVAREFNALEALYRDVIRDITRRMGNGMADFAVHAGQDPEGVSVKTVGDYELYCHYVAGLVGEGLTRLFTLSNVVSPSLLTEHPQLMESMGQLLQHVNIIRDVHEDFHSGRVFWPREIWSKHAPSPGDLFLPQNREKALRCSSEMILLALRRVEDCLSYMSRVHEQSTFNFVAIPQGMAIATLELCFRNGAMFERSVKISRGVACEVMIGSTGGFGRLCGVFDAFVRRIRMRNDRLDPNYDHIEEVCRRIEGFAQSRALEKRERLLGLGLFKMCATVLAVGAAAWGYLRTSG